MWPLTGLEVVEACAGFCTAPGLAELQIAGVKADGARPEPDELFVALREPAYDYDGHGWVLPYLRAGAALALVDGGNPGLCLRAAASAAGAPGHRFLDQKQPEGPAQVL